MPVFAGQEIYRADGDSTWNYYSADVTTTLFTEERYGYASPETYRTSTYHIVRTLGSSDVWASVTTFDDYLPLGPVAAGQPRRDILRIESDEAGAYFRVYDRAGTLLSNPSNSPTLFAPAARDTLDHPAAPSASPTLLVDPRVSRQADAARPDRNPRAWLDHIVVTPAAGARVRAGLERAFGASQGRVADRDRFVRVMRGQLLEVLVDPTIGAVVEQNLMDGGRLVQRVRYGYTKADDTTYVRTQIRAERARPDRPDARVIMEQVLTNIRTDTREVQP